MRESSLFDPCACRQVGAKFVRSGSEGGDLMCNKHVRRERKERERTTTDRSLAPQHRKEASLFLSCQCSIPLCKTLLLSLLS